MNRVASANLHAPPGLRHDAVQHRLRQMIALHFDRARGAAYWLDRAAVQGIDPLRDIRTIDDLALLGDMTPAAMCERPLLDFIPRRFHHDLSRFIVAQTGGTTGASAWAAWREDEFEQAFVEPFAAAARHLGFPRGGRWLYVGPSGPHIIGRAASRLARCMNSLDPFTLDFDPRWAKRLTPGSFALARYLDHVIEQAMQVIESQHTTVLFTTPAVLRRLAEVMSGEQRDAIEAVHYGGMALAPDELERLQCKVFPNALHLSGYGNTLFGCCLELCAAPNRDLDYFPFGPRLLFEVVDPNGVALPPGETGRVRFTRLDDSMLIVRMLERDEASLVAPPPDAPAGFVLHGLRNPSSPTRLAPQQRTGLY